MDPNRKGVLFIVASPSGGGKTTLIRETIERLAAIGVRAHFSVSHTTRAPRPGETDGVDYFFVAEATFRRMAETDEFLEWAEYAGFLYGTSRSEVEGRLAAGEDVFLDIEVKGANQVAEAIPAVVRIFVFPPSFPVLKERLTGRRKDSEETIRRRLKIALGELEVSGIFDYAIINDRLNEAVDVLAGICIAEHHRSERMTPRLDAIREEFRRSLEKDSGQ